VVWASYFFSFFCVHGTLTSFVDDVVGNSPVQPLMVGEDEIKLLNLEG
jgi:hypothetical protein